MFNIRTYLHKLENVVSHYTWDEATCPACGGKLKISKAYPKEGSYACYTSECHTRKTTKGVNLIRLALEDVSPFTQHSSPFKETRLFKASVDLKPTPIPITDVLNFRSDVEYVRPRIENNSETLERRIYFDYGEFQLVRVEHRKDVVSKYVYPIHYKAGQTRYTKGLPANVLDPFYRSEYIAKDIIMVEGEKCASFCQRLGLAAISVYTPFSSSFMLDTLMQTLYTKGVRNIVYLEDNDVPGKVKASKLLDSSWKAGIAAATLNITDTYPEFSSFQGFDIVDLYYQSKIVSGEDVVNLIERGLYDRNIRAD